MSTVSNATATATTAATTAASTATNTSATSSASSTSTAQKGLNSNYQDFLKLLTTQLQNQDPSQPIDTNQLTAQIASLSQVEQEINTNTKLDQLVSLYTSSQTQNAVSYIGKQVDATGNQVALSSSTDSSGNKTSSAAIVYNLPSTASSATVTVTNSAGATVFSAAGTTVSGRNQLLWNGNTTAGTTAPDGVYNFKVTATDSAGKAITATTYTSGVVTAVETANGSNNLSLGQLSVPLSSVQSIYTAGTNPGA